MVNQAKRCQHIERCGDAPFPTRTGRKGRRWKDWREWRGGGCRHGRRGRGRVVHRAARVDLLGQLGQLALEQVHVVRRGAARGARRRVHLLPLRVGIDALREGLQRDARAHQVDELALKLALARQLNHGDAAGVGEHGAQLHDVHVDAAVGHVARANGRRKGGELGREGGDRLGEGLVGRQRRHVQREVEVHAVHKEEDAAGAAARVGLGAVGRAKDDRDGDVGKLRGADEAELGQRLAAGLGGEHEEVARRVAVHLQALAADAAEDELAAELGLLVGQGDDALPGRVGVEAHLQADAAAAVGLVDLGEAHARAVHLVVADGAQHLVQREALLKDDLVVLADALEEGAHHELVNALKAVAKVHGARLEEHEPLAEVAHRGLVAEHGLALAAEEGGQDARERLVHEQVGLVVHGEHERPGDGDLGPARAQARQEGEEEARVHVHKARHLLERGLELLHGGVVAREVGALLGGEVGPRLHAGVGGALDVGAVVALDAGERVHQVNDRAQVELGVGRGAEGDGRALLGLRLHANAGHKVLVAALVGVVVKGPADVEVEGDAEALPLGADLGGARGGGLHDGAPCGPKGLLELLNVGGAEGDLDQGAPRELSVELYPLVGRGGEAEDLVEERAQGEARDRAVALRVGGEVLEGATLKVGQARRGPIRQKLGVLGEGVGEATVGRIAELGVVLALALLERGLHHDD